VANRESLQHHLHILLGSRDAPEPVLRAAMQVTIEQALHLPALCLLRLQDDDLALVDSSTFDIGRELQIQLSASKDLKPVFDGEIVGLELQPTQAGILTLVVRAFDRSHRLHRGAQARSFAQVTDGEIAQRIAHEVQLRPDVEATDEVHDYVLQDNRTNYQFLRERAEQIGYAFWVSEDRLHFRSPVVQQPAPISLEWGPSLQSFHPVLSAGRQVDEVIVRGWDPKKKRAITGKAAQGLQYVKTSWGQTGSQIASGAFGQAQSVVVHRPIGSQAEADSLAQALCDELSGCFIQAEGQATGMPELCPGRTVEIANVGQRFSGQYYVTSCVHRINNKAGYQTTFTASGSRAETLLDLIQPLTKDRSWVCVGVVTDNRDPDGYGRVKVRLPWLGEQVETTWARLLAPMAGKGRGFFFLPEVDDEVLVAFEQGDVGRACILGAVWNGTDGPPLDKAVDAQGQVVQRVIRSRAGHIILLDDTDGSEMVTIKDKSGAEIVMDKSGIAISKGGQNVKITQSSVVVNDGALEVK
jgi:phage protein D/phage baseplate assembly protein gpV